MNEYRKTIGKDRLQTPEQATQELVSFMLELFRVLGYEMSIAYRDDKTNGQREIKAKWEAMKPTTNADRIRAMSDEELAKFFAQQKYRKPVFDGWLPLCYHVMGPRRCHEDGCEKCWLDWLKQEATDG